MEEKPINSWLEVFKLATLGLLVINVLFQFFEPKAFDFFDSWDSQQIFGLLDQKRFDIIQGISTHTMYGPALPYTIQSTTTFSPSYPVGVWIWIGFHLCCFYRLYRQTKHHYWMIWIFISLLCLFNLPSLKYAPFIMFFWSCVRRSDEPEWSPFVLLGIFMTSWLWLYKSSWGMIASLHLITDLLVRHKNIKSTFEKFFCRGLFSMGFTYLLYFCLTSGNLSHFYDYVYYALEDAIYYPSYNSSPVEAHIIAKAWSPWQNWLHKNIFGLTTAENLIKWFPVISCILVFIGVILLRKNSYFWLSLPILFGEYKHSYVRADVTNLHGIFYLIPFFFVLALFIQWDKIKTRQLIFLFLAIWSSLEVFGFFPYNIPRRHPRHFWLDHAVVSHQQKQNLRKKSEQALEIHLNKYSDFTEFLNNKSVCSLPARNDLTLFGRPVILPSHQPYFTTEKMTRGIFDLAKLKEKKPDRIIFEDRLEPFRPGALHSFPGMMSYLMKYYDYTYGRDEWSILSKRDKPLDLEEKNLYTGIWKVNETKTFQLPPNSVIHITQKTAISLHEQFLTTLFKSPKLQFSIRTNEKDRVVHFGSRELVNGVILFDKFKDLVSNPHSRSISISLQKSYNQKKYEVLNHLIANNNETIFGISYITNAQR